MDAHPGVPNLAGLRGRRFFWFFPYMRQAPEGAVFE